MGIGIGVVLLAIGLVLALAIGGPVGGVDLALIGWILAGVGGLAIIVALIMTALRSHQTIEHVNRNETPSGSGTTTGASTGTGSSNAGARTGGQG
jgi:hypothetical protein